MTVETRPIPAVDPKVKSVPDVLRHAALIIEERGWCQVSFHREDGAHCMVGAVIAVSGHDEWVAAHKFLIARGLGMVYNDEPGRTAAEVTAALRAAADAAEAE